jgi:hypothetical protein
MYCTGGIRCDVYSALLRQKGFKNLYTLHGGIQHYLREEGNEHWQGSLFVFDGRMAINPALQKDTQGEEFTTCDQEELFTSSSLLLCWCTAIATAADHAWPTFVVQAGVKFVACVAENLSSHLWAIHVEAEAARRVSLLLIFAVCQDVLDVLMCCAGLEASCQFHCLIASDACFCFCFSVYHSAAAADLPLPAAVPCQLCGASNATLPHVNCANIDCNELFIACPACKTK